MAKFTQIQRIIQMLSWLAVGEKLTVSMVEQRFNSTVKRRQIQRDFLAIFDANLPITFDINGKEREWYFQNDYAKRISTVLGPVSFINECLEEYPTEHFHTLS
jgi:predicted DNA-binding transcriptional regulator YafY